MTGGGAGMTWSAGMTRKGEGIAGSTVMTGSVEMRVGTEVAPEACNSSPGNANRLLAHKWVKKKAVTQIHCGNMPCDILPPSSLYTPPSRPPPGVIPAQAGILTRVALYEGRTVANNYAAIPSRHISYGKGDELRVLKSLVWIRRICNSWRPCPD